MRYLIAFLLLSSMPNLFASTPVVGTFEATQSCPAYISKNKKTNPDNLMIAKFTRYDLKEINRLNNPDWMRISITDANQQTSLRWISKQCGIATFHIEQLPICEQNPGMADSYVFALSWQPGFCQTYGYEAGKPECLRLNRNSYQASHLVLHGLWPNQTSCGQQYGFCGVVPQINHCDYSPVDLDDAVASDLRQLMPSYGYGSCLERHEWNKHGSCQILSSNSYFSLALRLTREADASPLGNFLHDHVGQDVSLVQLHEMIQQSFGENALRKVYLGCKNGILVDIFIELPALIPANESLISLVNKAPEFSRMDGCPSDVKISDFNKESWF